MTERTTPAKARDGGWARLLRLSFARFVIEVKVFTRIPAQVFFSFLLPVLFLIVFGAVFSGGIEAGDGREVDFIQYFLPGIIASGVMSTTFANLAMAISVEQHEGLLKRLAGTPLPKAAYLAGKVAAAVALTVAQTALMLAVGVIAFGVDLPDGLARWGVFLLVLFFAAAVGAALGVAYTRLIRKAGSAPAIVQPPFLVLQFISGVFFRWQDLPPWLQGVASVFPLRWMAEGFRYAFLPDWFGQAEYGSGWGWERPLAILALWMVAAFVLAMAFFRWDRQRDG